MTRPLFLVDENMRRAIVDGVRYRNGAIDILHIGDPGAPPINTLDPAILLYCEQTHRMLVTNDRKSMPQHLADFHQAGGHHWGVLKVRKGREHDIGGIIESIVLIWELEEAEDYSDRVEWIPF